MGPLRFIPLLDGQSGKPRLCHARGQGMSRLRCSKPEVYCETELLSRPRSCQFRSKAGNSLQRSLLSHGFRLCEFEDCALSRRIGHGDEPYLC